MNEILTLSKYVKELGSTVLIVGASIWLLAKYIPQQMRSQGEVVEVIRHSSSVIENNTEALRMVSARDAEMRETLERIEKRVDEAALDVHDIKHTQQHRERTEQ